MNLNLILKDREELKNYEFIKGVGIDYCNNKEINGNHLQEWVVISIMVTNIAEYTIAYTT